MDAIEFLATQDIRDNPVVEIENEQGYNDIIEVSYLMEQYAEYVLGEYINEQKAKNAK